MPIRRPTMRSGFQSRPQRPASQPRSTFSAKPMSATGRSTPAMPTRGRSSVASTIANSRVSSPSRAGKVRGMQRSGTRRFNTGGLAGMAGTSIPLRKDQQDGAVYEVNGKRVTKEQYEAAEKKMDTPKSKAEEELFDFADKARSRNKMTPINKAKGGEAKKKPPGLYANIHAKRKRIAAGSGEKMRKVGSKGAPTKQAFIESKKTAKAKKMNKGGMC